MAAIWGMPRTYNYAGVFLTLRCSLGCTYCIAAAPAQRVAGRELTGAEWLAGLNRVQLPADLPLTLQGGEPTQHPDFYEIVGGLRPDLNIDLLTNLQFDVDDFMRRVPPERLRRPAPYASIRVSYHPERMDGDELLARVARLRLRGYSVGIWGVLHPAWQKMVLDLQVRARAQGIDFRTKEFLGVHAGRLYGTYEDPEAVLGRQQRACQCRTSELLIGPEGGVYRCHHDLYHDFPAVGMITDAAFAVRDEFRDCAVYGQCNPCDVKIKTNRFQQHGHRSVTITFPDAELRHG